MSFGATADEGPGTAPPPGETLAQRLRDAVEDRRRDGLYPEGLEHDLDLHYHHIAVRGVRDRFDRLRAALDAADAAGRELSAARIETASARTGGGALHRLVARLTHRQVEGTLTQVREYAEALAEAHRAMLLAYADLVSQIDDLRDRFEDGTTSPP